MLLSLMVLLQLLKDANVGGDRHLVIGVACIDEFCGNHLKDVGRNGQLRGPDVDKLLETTARTKVARYRETYALRTSCCTTGKLLPSWNRDFYFGKSPML